MTTRELDDMMLAARKAAPPNTAIVILTIPGGEGTRQMQWICNTPEQEAMRLVIDTGKIFERLSN